MRKALRSILKKLTFANVALVVAIAISGVSMYFTIHQVDSIDYQISKLTYEKDQNMRALSERWDLSGVLNNRLDTANMMVLLDKNSHLTKKYLRTNIQKYSVDQEKRDATIETFQIIAKEYEKLLLDKIDEYYSENFNLNQRIEGLQKDKNYYRSFAQLFQVLALVVALVFGRARA